MSKHQAFKFAAAKRVDRFNQGSTAEGLVGYNIHCSRRYLRGYFGEDEKAIG